MENKIVQKFTETCIERVQRDNPITIFAMTNVLLLSLQAVMENIATNTDMDDKVKDQSLIFSKELIELSESFNKDLSVKEILVMLADLNIEMCNILKDYFEGGE